jgi:hypothetical protein
MPFIKSLDALDGYNSELKGDSDAIYRVLAHSYTFIGFPNFEAVNKVGFKIFCEL